MSEWLDKIEAIGWDVDGTLYRPETIPKEVVFEMQIKALVDVTGYDPQKARLEFERMYAQLGSHTAALTALGVDGEDFFIRLWDNFPFHDFIHTDPRLTTVFRGLSNFKHFIISNSNRVDQIERKLQLLGLDPGFFTFIISTVELGAVKPDARPFLAALDRLGGDFPGHPERVLYIGDRLETDVIGAHRVGMKAGLVWGSSEAADISFPSVYDITKESLYAH